MNVTTKPAAAPCPFCGGKAAQKEINDRQYARCCCTPWVFLEEWNQRPPVSQQDNVPGVSELPMVKTWQQRSEEAMYSDTWYPAGHYKDLEIADLRAALRAYGQRAGVAAMEDEGTLIVKSRKVRVHHIVSIAKTSGIFGRAGISEIKDFALALLNEFAEAAPSQPHDGQRAEVSKPASYWLVESVHGCGWWDGRFLSRGIDPRHFMHDPNKAVRLARKEDADLICNQSSSLKATEHVWIDAVTAPPQPQQEAVPAEPKETIMKKFTRMQLIAVLLMTVYGLWRCK